jgi:Fe-S cluster assembly protein SufD
MQLPTRKNEYWKYNDFSFLAEKNFSIAEKIDADTLQDAIHQHRLRSGDGILLVLVNGYFMPELSDLAKLPEEVMACRMEKSLINEINIDAEKYPFANMNAGAFTDGLFLKLAENCVITAPLHLLSLTMGDQGFLAQPRNEIHLEENSQCMLLEEHYSLSDAAYMMNVLTSIHVGKNAKIEHYKIQREGRKAIHLASHFVEQYKDSHFSHVNFSGGAEAARDDVIVNLREAGAECHTSGYYHLREENQYIDNHININHIAAHSNSDMLYKGILDSKARAVFNGRLHVAKDAQKILAYQANHNLLLSKQAEIYSKPELEIYADDVKCKHGATTGQLDRDALFYLRSRGIPENEAIEILLQGFSEEILERVMHLGIRMRVLEVL